ncbi:MAG: SDR family oxidoreductase [Gammaproteobacteria bacterium]|nr:SDR family oxidoreductase [Gammaproteobacteria bacterium]
MHAVGSEQEYNTEEIMIKNILITGCSHGFGHALALNFAEAGCSVYAVSRNAEALEQLKANYPALIQPIVADIATEMGRGTITEQIMHQGKPISIIHNAAIAEPCPFDQLTEEVLLQHFSTNVFAPILITNMCLKNGLLAAGQRVLDISSGSADLVLPALLPYCSSKAALERATACMNRELSTQSVYCASLRPGMLDTPMQEDFRRSDVLPGRDFYQKAHDQKQLLSPELAAKFARWVLLNTDDLQFGGNLFNIYDVALHPNWLPQGVPAPAFGMVSDFLLPRVPY